MKKILIVTAFFILIALPGFGQKKTFVATGAEIIFSEASISDVKNSNATSTLRFAPVLNIQSTLNIDMSEKFGLFTGWGYRNVGYIYDEYSTVLPSDISSPIKKKFRTYNIAFPVGIKIGNMNGAYLYGGYEIEFPFVYKEKTFNTADEKISTEVFWFGNRANTVQQSWIVGIQLPYGSNIKFKYYFTEFHNQNFEVNGVKPYEGLKSNIWYISLTKIIFKNIQFVGTVK